MFYKAKIHIEVTGMKSLYTTQHRISKKKFDEFIRGVLSPAALTDLAKKVKFVQRSRKFLIPTFVAALFRSRADKEWTLSSIYRDYNALVNNNLKLIHWGCGQNPGLKPGVKHHIFTRKTD